MLMSVEDGQALLDAMAYPPTHTYTLDNLEPTGVLAKRLAVIKELAPDFFVKKESFLDVGCNKGFFSLYGSSFFQRVVGIDNRAEFVELCTKLKKPNTEFLLTDFRDYTPGERFDRILLGNVHHYIYRSCGGNWDWLYKLAAISSGLVIIEGPIDMTCPDMPAAIQEDIRDHFNYEEFIRIMSRFFVLKVKTPTVEYTPGRYVMLFERKPDWTENICRLSDLPIVRTFSENKYTKVFETKDDLICKVLLFFEDDYFSRVNIARMSPVSNGIVAAVYDGDPRPDRGWVGWLEKKIAGRFFEAYENELEIFKAHCRHQIFLARNGYLDFDVTPINFVLDEESGELICFDKNQINPISKLSPDLYSLNDGWYFRYLNSGFKIIYARRDILTSISNAMATGDSVKIENSYSKILEILNFE